MNCTYLEVFSYWSQFLSVFLDHPFPKDKATQWCLNRYKNEAGGQTAGGWGHECLVMKWWKRNEIKSGEWVEGWGCSGRASESYKGILVLADTVLPPTASTDQIRRLWELERDRLPVHRRCVASGGFFLVIDGANSVWVLKKLLCTFYFLFTAWASKPMHVLFRMSWWQ